MKKLTEKKWTNKFEERGEMVKNNNYGITLIALVITVIVLLILAGISISMLSGDNSILQKATEAKDSTEAATIKEQAEIIRNGMLIDKTTNNLTLTQGDLVTEIATDGSFVGSNIIGNTVVTKDQRYDINVASDLTITVTPHTDGGNEQETISFYINNGTFTTTKGKTWIKWAQETKDDESSFVYCECIYNSLQNFIINNSNDGVYNYELYSTDGTYELWFWGPDGEVKPLDEICDGRSLFFRVQHSRHIEG